MLIIESMDTDTETRRISPVAVLSNNGYLDLLNGPQDHSWCSGGSCGLRISTFMSLLISEQSYAIYLNNTPPNVIRFRILNSDPSFKVRLAVYYELCDRVDLYLNGTFVTPVNGFFINGTFFRNSTATYSSIPTPSSESGRNYYYPLDNKIYFTADGNSVFDLKIAPVMIVEIGVSLADTQTAYSNAAQIFSTLFKLDINEIRNTVCYIDCSYIDIYQSNII